MSFIFVIILVIWIRISFRVQLWAWETVKIIFYFQFFYSLFPFSSEFYLFCVSVGNIKWLLAVLWLGALIVLWMGVLKGLGLGELHILQLGLLSILCLGVLGLRMLKTLLLGLLCILGEHSWWVCKFPHQSSLCSPSSHIRQCGPHVQFFAACLGAAITLGIAATWGGVSVFTVGADVGTGVGGIGQSFLVSNRLSEVDPSLG